MTNWKAIAQWRDELRSGKWKQGQHHLRDANDNYCCLGVFCESVAGIPATPPDSNDPRFAREFSFDEASMFLPDRARGAMGVSYENPLIFGAQFADLNDDMHLTFDEIADLLDIALIERGDSIT